MGRDTPAWLAISSIVSRAVRARSIAAARSRSIAAVSASCLRIRSPRAASSVWLFSIGVGLMAGGRETTERTGPLAVAYRLGSSFSPLVVVGCAVPGSLAGYGSDETSGAVASRSACCSRRRRISGRVSVVVLIVAHRLAGMGRFHARRWSRSEPHVVQWRSTYSLAGSSMPFPSASAWYAVEWL